MRYVIAASLALAALSSASLARADVTSWLALGAGATVERSDVTPDVIDAGPNFSASIGVGSSPVPKLIVGGVFRALVNFGLGTDISLSARIATRGFVRGGFGLAVDVGPTYRYWRGGDYGRFPLQGVITIGFPAGLQLGLGGHFWSLDNQHSALGGFAVLEIDLLRLTLMRKDNLEQYWPNPSAAGDLR